MNWLNRKLYPFTSHYLEIDSHQVHYIDEGKGEVILFVHGTPEWSFSFRDLITSLSTSFRCIAPDHLGFGLSEKPEAADYTVKQHAARLEKFVEKLNLKQINLYCNDFGGSIALNYAILHPENIKRICIMNTWMWALNADPHFARPGKIMHSWFGKILYKKFNFPVNFMMKQAYGQKSKLTNEIHAHYKAPLGSFHERNGTYTFVKEILDSGPWWDSLWQKADVVQGKPLLIIWGMKDKLILPKELDKWVLRFPNAKVVRFEHAGHFVHEEEPDKVAVELRSFFSF